MAELTKSLHFLKDGTEQTAKAYSTTTESGDDYVFANIDGVQAYIPIGSISDTRATNGRVTKSGTTYAILKMAKPAYAEMSWTTAGTYTWTAPMGVTRVKVAVVGGGGSGYSNGGNGSAGSGGTSKFGSLLQATGGGGGTWEGEYWNDTEDYSDGYGVAGTAGSPNGNTGKVDKYNRYPVGGGAGFALSFTKTSGSYGQGGKGIASGGGGGYNTGYVNVTAGTSYSITVGAGGRGYSHGSTGEAGNSGYVYIAFGGDI